MAGEDDTRRRVAFKLFRATLAADTEITQKKNVSGELVLALVYSGNETADRLRAENYAKQFKKNKSENNIRKLPVKVTLLSDQSLLSGSIKKKSLSNMAGIYFLDELSNNSIRSITELAIKHQLITYSPFKGDVEMGVFGGLSVEAKVRPYINMKTLEQSNIHLKSFFLKVIKRYEP